MASMLNMLAILCVMVLTGCLAVDVDVLLSEMSLEEKVGQMVQIDIDAFIQHPTAIVNYTKIEVWINEYKIGSMFNSPYSNGIINGTVGWNATQWRTFIHNIQNITKNSGLQMPVLFGLDSIHGASYVYESAMFPQALTVAASFNPDIAYTSGRITAKDTRAAGVAWLFSPVLGIALQPLWARFPETFGEDPYLVSQMGTALINGIQDIDLSTSAGSPSRAAACMKHFIAYSDPINGHDRSPVPLPDVELRQLFLPSFQTAIDTGVLSAMESYQSVGGVPIVSSSEYLRDLLRYEMNFTGMMVTDYMEIQNLVDWHKVASTNREAVKIAMLDTTIDMSMVPLDGSFFTDLIDLVQTGEVPISRIDDSVRRILQLKQTLGLFDEFVPSIEDDVLVPTVGQTSDWNASLAAALESVTLLKNVPRISPDVSMLPLSLSVPPQLVVTGVGCDSLVSQTGGWTFHWQGASNNTEFTNGVTIRAGLQTLLNDPNIPYFAGPLLDAMDLEDVSPSMDDVLTAVAAADAVVACVGEGAYAEKPGDINTLDLPGGQVQFVEQLNSTGTPIILVIVSGRPRVLQGLPDLASAVIEAYQPGPMGGQAVADVIFGVASPSGRLPFSYPLDNGNAQYPYHHKPEDQCVDALGNYIICEVQWVFGEGLNYHNFTYSPLVLTLVDGIDVDAVDEAGSVNISTVVTNNGNWANHDDSSMDLLTNVATGHSVLFFLFDVFRRVAPEYKLLKRFIKVFLKPGESAAVSFTLTSDDLKYIGINNRYVLESGEFRVGLGHTADCRDHWNVSYASGVCGNFSLVLSEGFNDVCSYACGMWANGICGIVVEENSCMQVCQEQNWTWNYVDCLEQSETQGLCNANFQCFDAFQTTENVDSGDECVDPDTAHVLLFGVLCAVIGGAITTVIMCYLLSHGYLTTSYDMNRISSISAKGYSNIFSHSPRTDTQANDESFAEPLM